MNIKKDIQSILVIVLGFLLLYFIFRWQGFLVISVVLGLPGLLSSYLRTYIVKGWEKLAKVLGFINSRIILSVIFFLILTPIALLSRLFSKDRMQLRRKRPEEDSYFKIREHEYGAEDFENPW